MSDLHRSVKQRSLRSDILHPVLLSIFAVLFSVLVNACDTERYQTPGKLSQARFMYELRITTTESYSQIVDLHQAQIRVNGKEQPRIAFIAGTRIIEVPFQYIQTIRFSSIGSSSLYSGPTKKPGSYRIRMEIFAEGENGQPNGVSITCDSIPDFYIIGQESRYVKRILRNNTQNFDMQEIQFLQMTDLAAKPQPATNEPKNPQLP